MRYYILFIICFLSLIFVASAVTPLNSIFEQENPRPQPKEATGANPQTTSITIGAEPTVSENIYYPQGQEDPILIKKSIDPASKEGYLLGDVLKIYVELSNEKKDKLDKNIEGLSIRELVDDGLQISSPLFFNKSNTLPDICNCKLELYREGPINLSQKEIKGIRQSHVVDNYYLFNWDKVFQGDNTEIKRLEENLTKDFDILWAEDGIINKSITVINGNTSSNVNDSVRIIINDENKGKLKESRGVAADLTAKNENGNTIIYDNKMYLCNIDNILKNDSNETKRLLKNLSDKYNIVWAKYGKVNRNRIVINNSLNPEDGVQFDIDNNDARMNISDDRSYCFQVGKDKNGQTIINDSNTIQQLYVKDFSPKDTISFWYYVKPKKDGVFPTETRIRLYDNDYSAWPDIVYPLNVEVTDPATNFEVVPRVPTAQDYVWNSTNLTIIYDVTYVGGLSKFNWKTTSIKPENETNYFRAFSSTPNPSNKQKTKRIEATVKYIKDGTWPIPGIWVNNIYYSFKEEKIRVLNSNEAIMEYLGPIGRMANYILSAFNAHSYWEFGFMIFLLIVFLPIGVIIIKTDVIENLISKLGKYEKTKCLSSLICKKNEIDEKEIDRLKDRLQVLEKDFEDRQRNK